MAVLYGTEGVASTGNEKEALDKAENETAGAIEELTKFIFFDEKMPNYIALRLDGHFEN